MFGSLLDALVRHPHAPVHHQCFLGQLAQVAGGVASVDHVRYCLVYRRERVAELRETQLAVGVPVVPREEQLDILQREVWQVYSSLVHHGVSQVEALDPPRGVLVQDLEGVVEVEIGATLDQVDLRALQFSLQQQHLPESSE